MAHVDGKLIFFKYKSWYTILLFRYDLTSPPYDFVLIAHKRQKRVSYGVFVTQLADGSSTVKTHFHAEVD